MGNKPKMSYEEYLRCVQALDQSPLLELSHSEWHSVMSYAYVTMRNFKRSYSQMEIAARAIICERFQASLRQALAAYPEFFNMRDVLDWTTHPDFNEFARMFMGHRRQRKKIPVYLYERISGFGASNGLNCRGLVPLKNVEKIY